MFFFFLDGREEKISEKGTEVDINLLFTFSTPNMSKMSPGNTLAFCTTSLPDNQV